MHIATRRGRQTRRRQARKLRFPSEAFRMPQEVSTTAQFRTRRSRFVVTFPDGSRIQGTGTVVGETTS
jgi:hypothetical protein